MYYIIWQHWRQDQRKVNLTKPPQEVGFIYFFCSCRMLCEFLEGKNNTISRNNWLHCFPDSPLQSEINFSYRGSGVIWVRYHHPRLKNSITQVRRCHSLAISEQQGAEERPCCPSRWLWGICSVMPGKTHTVGTWDHSWLEKRNVCKCISLCKWYVILVQNYSWKREIGLLHKTINSVIQTVSFGEATMTQDSILDSYVEQQFHDLSYFLA